MDDGQQDHLCKYQPNHWFNKSILAEPVDKAQGEGLQTCGEQDREDPCSFPRYTFSWGGRNKGANP